MATKQRSRSRRPNPRDRAPRYVAPVLDPNWQNPYAPSVGERHANARALRRFALRRVIPQAVVVGVVVVALLAAYSVSYWLPVAGVVLAGVAVWAFSGSLHRAERQGASLGASLAASFRHGGSTRDSQRLTTVLDRLAATFGVDGVRAVIVEDPGYNAALVPDGSAYVLLVTSALMADFELIELEGVVAHLLARQRLGLLGRESLSGVVSASDEARRALAGAGLSYRADEVAAAAIRYPLGLAGALRRCARQAPPAGSYFATPAYGAQRWIWFDQWSGRTTPDLSDLDDAELRAMALEEW